MREPLSHDQMLYICRMSEEGGVGVPERGLLKGELLSVAKVDSLSSRKFGWSGLWQPASFTTSSERYIMYRSRPES